MRHGHVEGIQPELFGGRMDVPLTEEGTKQSALAAQFIASRWHPVLVYANPPQRCVQTAFEIAKACGVETAVIEELNELDYGTWKWGLHSEIRLTTKASRRN
ncbi:MAG: phosphoglycerate mutase family protein [Pseudomonadota bacterium]|jgi:probable phosphoglycerate mutase|nr:phosphoglycerate mutase family protein [Pseudomonadota bacterium]